MRLVFDENIMLTGPFGEAHLDGRSYLYTYGIPCNNLGCKVLAVATLAKTISSWIRTVGKIAAV